MSHTFRYHVDRAIEPGMSVVLSEADAHHLVRVVRRAIGDPVEIIDGDGRIWPAAVSSLEPAQVTVGEAPRTSLEAAPVEVYVGLAEWGRIDLLIEKATELGVGGITLFTSDRSRRADADVFDRRRERMLRLSEAAARQSGHGRRPELRGLVPLSAVIDVVDRGTFLLDQAAGGSLGDALRAAAPASVRLVIGPDAGLNAGEAGRVVAAGATACTLAAGTLRAETAAIAACAVAVDWFTGSRS